jgi:hypothetical protein
MKVYTFSEARQQLAALLDQARREGQVRIRRRDGEEFVVEAAAPGRGSPLDVPGLDLTLAVGDVVGLIRETRASTERFLRPVRTRQTSKRPARSRKRRRRSETLYSGRMRTR